MEDQTEILTVVPDGTVHTEVGKFLGSAAAEAASAPEEDSDVTSSQVRATS